MKNQTLICIYIFISVAFNAQEKLGITNSNYSSTNSIFLNPSSSVDSKTYWQLNFVGSNFYGMTSLGYIPKFSLWGAIKTGGIGKFEISDLHLKKILLVAASVEGPAFVISKGEYGAGIFVRARSVGELKGVPFDLADFILKHETSQFLHFPSSIDLKNIRFSNMSWVEYGVNFGKMIKKNKNNLVSIGGSVRYLTGLNIAYGDLQRVTGAIDLTGINIDKVKGKLRLNEFGWGTGRGAAIDIGITYKKTLEIVERHYANSTRSGCKYIDYKYKIGISLRDLGAIRFNKNTTTSEIDGSGHFDIDTTNNRKINFQADLKDKFSTPVTHNPILASMPTALSVQLDWNFGNHFYLNGTVIKNLVPNTFTGVQGSNLISVCPRYEFKEFEIAMPLTLQKFIYPQLGFTFRFRSFVLGFDNMFPLIFKKKTYGLNVYFNIGISRFTNPACNPRRRTVDSCAPHSLFKKKKKEKKRKLAPPRKNNFAKLKRMRR